MTGAFFTQDPRADALQDEIYRQMAPERRLEIALAMQAQARELMDAGPAYDAPEPFARRSPA
jgi:hypothetical protein